MVRHYRYVRGSKNETILLTHLNDHFAAAQVLSLIEKALAKNALAAKRNQRHSKLLLSLTVNQRLPPDWLPGAAALRKLAHSRKLKREISNYHLWFDKRPILVMYRQAGSRSRTYLSLDSSDESAEPVCVTHRYLNQAERREDSLQMEADGLNWYVQKVSDRRDAEQTHDSRTDTESRRRQPPKGGGKKSGSQTAPLPPRPPRRPASTSSALTGPNSLPLGPLAPRRPQPLIHPAQNGAPDTGLSSTAAVPANDGPLSSASGISTPGSSHQNNAAAQIQDSRDDSNVY